MSAVQSSAKRSILKSLVKSAKEFQLKLFDTGAFQLDLSQDNNGTVLCSSIKGSIDAGAVLSIASRDGYTFHDLSQGVNLSGSPILNEYKELLTSQANLTPVEYKPIKRQLESWVLSGKELDKELESWGLNNPGQVFQSMKVLGIDLSGKNTVPIHQGSHLGFKKSIALTGNGRVSRSNNKPSLKSSYGAGSDLDVAIQYIEENNIPHDFERVHEALLMSGLWEGEDEDSVFDLAFLACDALGVPLDSSSGLETEGAGAIQRNWNKSNPTSPMQFDVNSSNKRIPIQQDFKGMLEMIKNWLQRVHEGLMEQSVFYSNLMRLLRGNGYPGSKANTIYEELMAGRPVEAVLASFRLIGSVKEPRDSFYSESQMNIMDVLTDSIWGRVSRVRRDGSVDVYVSPAKYNLPQFRHMFPDYNVVAIDKGTIRIWDPTDPDVQFSSLDLEGEVNSSSGFTQPAAQ